MYNIFVATKESPVVLAAHELVRYGGRKFTLNPDPNAADVILHSENTDRFQDSFSLRSRDGKLYITGSNGRSVLYGVYKYLKHFGFAFLYPGPEGEILPKDPSFTLEGFDLQETASRTFRGMYFRPYFRPTTLPDEQQRITDCLHFVSFLAKNQYNLLFMEGYCDERPGDLYSSYDGNHPLQHVEYLMRDVPWAERQRIAREQEAVVEEARRFGLLIERGGHGWNYGIPRHYAARHHISEEEAREHLKAKGNIKSIAGDSAWFQICLSSEEVREMYAEHIMDYLVEHRGEMDIAAIWMGDGYDNKCQCENCVKQPFSDLYLDIFRRVALKARKMLPGLTLECLIYFETLEPPTRNWLEGLDNVILNLAVWRQCYLHKLDDPACALPDWIPDYRHNATHDNEHGKRIINYDQYLPYAGWRKVIGNQVKCLVYTYNTYVRNMDRHFLSYDAKLLLENSIDDFDRMNIDGMTNCHCRHDWDQPANLQLYVAGRVLWNKADNDAGAIRRELFQALYEDKAEQVTAYCDKMNALLLECGGDFHQSLESIPGTQQKLLKGLQNLKNELDAIGALPCGRERYFRISLNEMIANVTPPPAK